MMRGSGGTPGGLWLFGIGFCLCMIALLFFFQSVIIETAPNGIIGRAINQRGGGAMLTTSMGILFVPFFLGVMALFYNAKMKWAWWLTWIGVGILVTEIMSRFYFRVEMRMTHLLIMLIMFAAGAALMLRSYHAANLDESTESEEQAKTTDDK